MTKKDRITRKTFVLTAVIGSLLLIFMVSANTIWSSRQTNVATDEAVSEVSSFYLEAMADRRAKTITNLINNNFDQMDKAVQFIDDEDIYTKEELQAAIGKVKSLLSLDRFALVDDDDIVYTQYTTYTGGSRHAFLLNEKMDEKSISTVYLYGSSKQLCLAAPTSDLSIRRKKFKASFVQIDIREIVDLLAFDDQGRTYFGLYSRNGKNLSDTELGPFIGKQNLFEATKSVIREADWKKCQDSFEKGEEGSLAFTALGVEETLCYVPIEDTDWEMVVLISESVIHDRIRNISEKNLAASKHQIIFTLVLVLLFSAVLLIELMIMSRKNLEAEKETSKLFRNMANTDSMTGVRNKHAYSENEAYLNQKIMDNEIEKLGIVVCDINGLKYVNDTQGHAAGDKLIKDASNLICEYYNHGSVFRIGGDEFVVILQDKGYDTMIDVARELNRKIEDNIKTNSVVVAIGYSELTDGDNTLREVFERADQMMYERKKELKEIGAKTRLNN
ncbi:MAG: diguanylate cyclase [Lachnospiraceae bacterium]|nr:diguanylate cyclase [Lachnospiraceae bacterium]